MPADVQRVVSAASALYLRDSVSLWPVYFVVRNSHALEHSSAIFM